MLKAVATGVFDGVHPGHRHLLDQLKAEAAARGLRPVALTFSCHPLSVVSPGSEPPLIISPGERLERLRIEGVEPEILDFTPEMRAMSAAEFLQDLSRRGVRLLLMGFNNCIGSDRLSGDSPALAEAAARAGIELLVASERPGGAVSSSEVRRAVSEGNMERAATLLGRLFALEGEVVTGRRVGRTIGFPTANVSVPDGLLMPPAGVYEARALGHKAVVNIGRRPTLDNGTDVTVEAHLLDFSGDLYGSTLRLEFLRRLRPEMKFPSLDALKSQIAADVAAVRQHL